MLSPYFKITLFLGVVLFQSGFCRQCEELESGDVSQFDMRKYEGDFEFILGMLNEEALPKLKLNCNNITISQHAHPNGGINVYLRYENGDENHTIEDTALPHFNSSTDIYGVEIGYFDRYFKKWLDVYYKILLAVDDVLAYSACIKNEDNPSDTDFLIFVVRRIGSKLTPTDIKAMLPDSVKNKPELLIHCDH